MTDYVSIVWQVLLCISAFGVGFLSGAVFMMFVKAIKMESNIDNVKVQKDRRSSYNPE